MRRLCTHAALLLLALVVGASATAATLSEQLYDQYEKLNSPENLGKPFPGGMLYPFQEEQVRLLGDLEKRPTAEAARTVVRIIDEFLARIEALGAEKFRQSPLQALQLPIVSLCDRHAGSDLVFARLEALAQSPMLKEYARGRAVGTVARRRLREVKPEDDADGRRRAKILFDLVIGDISFSRLLHAPARLAQFAAGAESIAPGNPLLVRSAFAPAADTLPRGYAAGCAFAVSLTTQQLKKKKALSDEEKTAMLAACDEWLKKYRPAAAKERYYTDVLGDAFLVLGGCAGNEELAALLRANGLEPKVWVEPPPGLRHPPTPRK